MEEKRTPIDYIEQIMKIFGISMIMLTIFCILFGEDAKGFSSIFALGKEGIPLVTMLQFLSVAVWIVFVRVLFFTDLIIKRRGVVFRASCMLLSILVIMVAYIWLFQWFPIGDWLCWCMFFASFGISFVISLLVTLLKERWEKRRMEEALRRLKEQIPEYNTGKEGER